MNIKPLRIESVSDCARRLGVSETSVYAKIKRGELEAYKHPKGRRWIIHSEFPSTTSV